MTKRAPPIRSRPSREVRRQATRWPLAGAALLLLLVLFAAGKVAQQYRADSRRSHVGELAIATAKARGTELLNRKQYLESLRYFREAMDDAPDRWQTHVDYSVALLNAVHQGTRHLGLDQFAVRGSPERVAMVQEALVHLVTAESLAIAAQDRRGVAWARGTRGQLLSAWGLPWDAFVAYRQAEWTDSTVPILKGKADQIMGTMKRPSEQPRPR